MSQGFGRSRQQFRTLVMCRIVGCVVLVLLIFSSILMQDTAHAFSTLSAKGTPHTHAPPPSHRQDFLKKQEGAWFQLSHFGKQHPRPNARLKALKQARTLRRFKPIGTGAWTPLGPQPLASGSSWGLVSGRITAAAVNPSDSNDIWVGAADGGVWHSPDGGSSWQPVLDQQQTLAIGSIAIDPTNPSTIYVGTGEANFSGDSYWGIGVLKSTDDGATWIPYGFNIFGGFSIGKIAVDPANSQILLLSVSFSPSAIPSVNPGNGGIWRSTNGGITWAQVLSSPFGTDVLFDPANPTIAFAALGGDSPASGIYESMDSGQRWTLLSTGIPTGVDIFRASLGISSDGSHLYAVLVSGAQFGFLLGKAIYVSTDTGATWTAKDISGVPGLANTGQWWYDVYSAVDPSDSTGNTAYVGGIDVFQTTDGGTSWTNLTNAYTGGPVHPDQHALAFLGSGSSSFVIGCDGGVWLGSSAGAFTNLNAGGLNTIQFYGGSVGEVGSFAQLYGGAQDNGEDQYPAGSSGAVQWNEVFGGDGGYTVVDYTNNAVVYEEYIFGAISKSTDGGATWANATNGLGGNFNFIAPFIISPSNNNELLAGSDMVFRTTDGATSWVAISPSLDGGVPISALAFAPSNDSVIYVGDDAGKVFFTTDGGTTWNGGPVPGSTGGMVRGIAVDPTNASIVYVSFANFAPGPGQHVFKSIDGGAHWSDISITLPDIPFDSILAIGTGIIAGSDVGVFVSINGGSSWFVLGDGLPNVVVDQVFTNRGGTKLFLATHGRGMWMLPLA